jgi:hypothetical protein
MDPSENLNHNQIQRLDRNLADVRQRMAEAARRSDRAPQEVSLVAVTKRTPVGAALALRDLGVEYLGESRPEELCRKAQLAPVALPWHLIGPLQTKKIARTLPHAQLIHSVSSVRLGTDIGARVGRSALGSQEILMQVNISGEEAKQGFEPVGVADALQEFEANNELSVRGLMTMAPRGASEQQLRDVFGALRTLRDGLGGSERLPELSMGMSGDFEVAIEEGATLVRVGSALFEGLGLER